MLLGLNAPLPSPSRRTGGWRQVSDNDASAEPLPKRCKFAESMLKTWAKGKMSAPELRTHFHNPVDDGCEIPAVDRISRIGGNSLSDQHCHSGAMQLMSSLGFQDHLTKVVDGTSVHEMILPSTLFRLLHDKHYDHF